MAEEMLSAEQLVLKMFEVEGLKFGEFTVRTGESTPVYIDMRVIWSYPDIVTGVSELIWKEIQKTDVKFDFICGLPYQGIPIASYLSTKYNIPMLLKRQKTKSYGTGRLIEGQYTAGQRVLLIDDVIMTGGTLVEYIPEFEKEGLEVIGCASFYDRDQGGIERTQHIHGILCQRVMTLQQAIDILVENGKIGMDIANTTRKYLNDNRFDTEKHGMTGEAHAAVN